MAENVPSWVKRQPYIGPPCSTCGASHPFDNVFCSNGFHAPPDRDDLDDADDDDLQAWLESK